MKAKESGVQSSIEQFFPRQFNKPAPPILESQYDNAEVSSDGIEFIEAKPSKISLNTYNKKRKLKEMSKAEYCVEEIDFEDKKLVTKNREIYYSDLIHVSSTTFCLPLISTISN